MAKPDLKNMDVNALLTLRADVEKALAERSRDLYRQFALLDGDTGKGRGRPAVRAGRPSVMRGKKVAPKYRGPGGETWAGRGATPRWLRALIDEGHSVEEFTIGKKGGKRTVAAKKKGRKPTPKKRGRKIAVAKEAADSAA